ncbi:MAG: cell wall hydrolase/autolysin [Edaphobacter sp.]|nr:cell wall hydrolase/autolysin [Edaphobacter sp.]
MTLAFCVVASLTARSQATPQPQIAAPVPPKPQPAVYRNLVLLDPAHGGADTGAQLPNSVLEKDVTLALAARIRPLLATAGFTLLTTRDTDAELTTDQRAGIANHARPTVCLVIHATSSGTGVHLFTSALDARPTAPRTLPWDTAQAASIPQSLRLVNELGLALDHAKLPLILSRASVRPLDNLTCPAVAIELAPLPNGTSRPFAVTDSAYQQQVAQAVAAALISWRTHNPPPPPPASRPVLPAAPQAIPPAQPKATPSAPPPAPAPPTPKGAAK